MLNSVKKNSPEYWKLIVIIWHLIDDQLRRFVNMKELHIDLPDQNSEKSCQNLQTLDSFPFLSKRLQGDLPTSTKTLMAL